MTRVVDLHPEELLDRDARGELSSSEEVRLEAHLARCAACRFERQVRGDFADELASDLSPSLVDRIALAGSISAKSITPVALTTPVAPPAAPELAAPPQEIAIAPRPPRRVTRATWLFAAAALLAVSVAGATGAGQRAWSRIVGAPAPIEVEDARRVTSRPSARLTTARPRSDRDRARAARLRRPRAVDRRCARPVRAAGLGARAA